MNKRELACVKAVRYVGVGWGHGKRNLMKFDPETEKDKFKLDCAGLLVETSQDIELFEDGFDMGNYSRIPDGSSLTMHLNRICDYKNKDEMQKADILVMTFNGNPTHLAMYLGDYLNNGNEYFIHASLPDKKVVIQGYNDYWKSVTTGVYSFKGIDN